MRSSITGTSYREIEASSWEDVANAHGMVATQGSGEEYPALSNGELIALIQAWKRASARSSQPGWGEWYEIALDGLGWQQPGDRFNMTKDHAQAPADPAAVALFWESVDRLAQRLDGARTVVKPLIIDYTFAAYEQAARDAWREMQRVQTEVPSVPGRKPIPLPDDPEPPPVPHDPRRKPSPDKPAKGGGDGILIALLIAAYVLRKRRS